MKWGKRMGGEEGGETGQDVKSIKQTNGEINLYKWTKAKEKTIRGKIKVF